MTDQPKKPASPFASIGGIAGAIGGWAISQYCGAAIWTPGAAILVLLILFAKTSLGPRQYKAAILVTCGHLFWFVLAAFLTGQWSASMIDVALLTAAIGWLWARPGTASVIFLGLLQLVSLAVNAIAISTVVIGDDAHRALTAHCLLRVLALLALGFEYAKIRKSQRALELPAVPADEII